jgi:redox-sensitive bicupin YhaK (pirin superfamily)
MSWHDCPEGQCRAMAAGTGPIEMVIAARTRDLGGFEVRRALPSSQRRMVGPFIFFDQMGPSEFRPGEGLDVLAHPHIGLATVTYLFHGEIMHRDSLGSVQPIRPGAVNWMTAGRGIAHSERTPPGLRAKGAGLFGIQAWVALPKSAEETEPAFSHHADSTLPVIEEDGLNVRIIAGTLYGGTSPVRTFSETIYADAAMEAGAVLPFDARHQERAIYVAEGQIEIGGQTHGQGTLLVLRPGDVVKLNARSASRALLLGGEPMDGPRYIWWNFVSSHKERIEQAKADWKTGRFSAVVDETEFIPLPEMRGP